MVGFILDEQKGKIFLALKKNLLPFKKFKLFVATG